jgi:hypothetical protein
VEQLTDLITPVAIRVAAAIGLLSEVGTGPIPLSELSSTLTVDEPALRRLVRFLAVRGVLDLGNDGMVSTTAVGRQLADPAGPHAARLDWRGAAGELDRTFVRDCLQAVIGRRRSPDLWSAFDRDPALSESFDLLMSARAAEWTDAVIDLPLWSRLNRIADLGGGRGHLLFRLLQAWPHLHGVLVERPGPAAAARIEARRLGLGDRARVLTGDLRRGLPGDCDAYVLAHVLHDWDDAGAIALLERAAAACRSNGQVIVIERELVDEATAPTRLEATAQDLRLFVLFGGGERTPAGLMALGGSAGLTLRERHPLSSGRSLLVFCPSRDAP